MQDKRVVAVIREEVYVKMNNLFQERIQVAIRRSRRDPKEFIPEGDFTIGEFISAIFSIEDETDAKALYDGYLDYLRQQADIGGTPEDIARSNIGWCFGEGMVPERIKMWVKVCGASHPVFGTTVPSLQEAFSEGVKRGKLCKRG